ncbi:hypothetical protein MMC07_001221 [Pseudocyphellaria aurata]|nr:hypothetical protein [Pseudocyphellaria aurata]
MPDDSASSSIDIEQAEPLLSSSKSSSKYEAIQTHDSPYHAESPASPEGPSSTLRHLVTHRAVEYDTEPEDVTFGRNVSWMSAYILIISRVIGSGIFATPGVIFRSVGSVGLSLCLWVVGSAIAACGLAISLELGCMLPRSGGEKVYLEFMYRRPRFLASTIVAVQAVLLGFTASNAIVFGQYTLFALHIEPTAFSQRLLAVGMLTVITVIHGCLLKTGIMIQNALGWVKIVVMSLVVFAGLATFVFGTASPSNSAPTVNLLSWDEIWKDSNWRWGVVSTAIFKVSYSYAGFGNVNNVMNEVKDPVRTLKTVGPAALLTICVFYFSLNLAYFMVMPLEEIRESGQLIGALFFQKLFGEAVGRTILPLLIAISAFGNVMVVTFTSARVNQEIARQGFLPFSTLLSSSRPFNTPLGGLIVHYIPSVLVITIPPKEDVYAFILDVEGYPSQFISLAVGIGLLMLRRTRPDLRRPFVAWIPAVLLKIVLSVALLAAPFVQPPKNGKGDVGFWYATYAVVGTGIFVFAVVYWYLWTVAVPRWRGYRLEEEFDVLEDGTSVTKLVKVKRA